MTTRAQNNPTYRTWKCMLRRCYSPSAKANSSYQGKGIAVCPRWRASFDNFVQDMGERPDGYTIDRIDDDGNYEPCNCKWSTYKEQNNGKSHPRVMLITIDGETNNLKEWCRRFGLKYTTVYARLKNGWPQTKALELHKRLEEYPMTDRKWDHESVDHTKVGPSLSEEYPTNKSRVEAVARAIAIFVGNDPDARQLGRKDSPLLWELHKSCALAAIEANDEWFRTGPKKGMGFFQFQTETPPRKNPFEEPDR